MKRFALILLLLVVPLEASWAVVAPWCQHEQGQAAQHFGHHEHEHQASDHGSDSDTGKPHGDCGFCHFSSAQFLSNYPAQIQINQAAAVFDFRPISYTSHIPDGLDRPNRRLTA